MRTLSVILCGLAVWVLLCGSARAQCTKDADCKGTRVCNQGECVEPSAPKPPPPPGMVRTVLGEPSLAPPETGWATGSAILGFVFSGVALALTAASAATIEDDTPLPAAPLGGVVILTTIVMTPVVSSGGSSARRLYPNLRGSPGLQISSWVTYGISIAEGIAMLVLAVPGVDLGAPHPALIGTCGLMGMTSIILMSADSLVSRSEAWEYFEKHGGKLALELDDEPAFELSPVVAPVIDLDGRSTSGATLGLAGRF
jgi:hypothetical protein